MRSEGIIIIFFLNVIIFSQAAFNTHSDAFTRNCIHLNSLILFLCIPTAFDPPRTSYRIQAHSKPSVARCAHLMHSGNIRQKAFTSIWADPHFITLHCILCARISLHSLPLHSSRFKIIYPPRSHGTHGGCDMNVASCNMNAIWMHVNVWFLGGGGPSWLMLFIEEDSFPS